MRYFTNSCFSVVRDSWKNSAAIKNWIWKCVKVYGINEKVHVFGNHTLSKADKLKILSCCYIFLTWYRLYRITARSALNFLAIKNIRAIDVPTGLKPFSAQSLLTSLKKTAIACVRQQGKQVIFWKGWIKKWRFKRIGLFTVLYLLFLVRSHDRSYIRHL